MGRKPIKTWIICFSTKTCTFIGTVIVTLVVANIVIVHIGLDSERTRPIHREHHSRYYNVLQKHFVKENGYWKFPSKNERLSSESFNPFRGVLDCSSLSNITNLNYIATGWTKVSYHVRIKSEDIALKMVNVYGHDVTECLLVDTSLHLSDCYYSAASKLVREVFLLKEVPHQNIVKLLGYCIPDTPYNGDLTTSVLVATELGKPIDVISLLQMPWEDRLKISLDMAFLLYHMAHSPLGSLLISDFRRQQFVLVKGKLKLSDVDDIVINDPVCTHSENCTVQIPHCNSSSFIPCYKGICHGFNEKKNIFSAGRHFMNFLLSHGVPGTLQPYVSKIVDAYSKALWRTDKLLQKTEEVVYRFVHGLYRKKTSAENPLKNYEIYQNSDLPGLYDYHCQLTLSGHGCTLSMFDATEAAQVCSGDIECKAFVLTNDTTWTGRKIVHFKNGFSIPTESMTTTLFVKRNDHLSIQ